LRIDGFVAKGRFKHLPVTPIILQFLEHTVYGFTHFIQGGNRRKWLQVEVIYSAIPHKTFLPRQVAKARRVSGGERITYAVAKVMVKGGKSRKLLVTTGARYKAVFAQPAIVK
jgi:hypothetical protein